MEPQRERFQKLYMLFQKHGIPFNEKEVRKAYSLLDRQPDVRERKIAKIKKAIDTGKYQPQNEKVASKLFKEHLETTFIKTQDDDEHFLSYLLKNMPTGKEYCTLFQKLCSIYVSEIFEDDLSSPNYEKRGSKGHKRYDLMLYNKSQNGFWSDMKKAHHISHVVFEFKNWEKSDYRKFSRQINDYSESNRAVILVTRDEPDEKMFYELSDIYRKIPNSLPLAISANNLNIACNLKLEGSSPSKIFEDPYLRLQAA